MFVLFGVLTVMCRSVYCLYVNVFCTTATGCLPNCSKQNIYIKQKEIKLRNTQKGGSDSSLLMCIAINFKNVIYFFLFITLSVRSLCM
jgi:hypothetical protein